MSSSPVRLGSLGVAILLVAAPAAAAEPSQGASGQGDYALDAIPRFVEPKGRLRCPDLEFVRYTGDVVRYHEPVKVYAGFVERLRRFEEVVREVAVEVYGRAPRRLVHIGTYNCRRIRAWPQLLSEHALGNAIDVLGFDFGAVSKRDVSPPSLPRGLRHPFRVRVDDHWTPGRRANEATRVHAHFLRTLARRLIARDDVFRVLLGPSYPGHKDHFHFDMAPWPMVDVFEPGEEPELAP